MGGEVSAKRIIFGRGVLALLERTAFHEKIHVNVLIMGPPGALGGDCDMSPNIVSIARVV